MELNQLRCFVAVSEQLHFGRAARQLHMTQPPLSRQIQLLERSVGVQLLERSSRAVRLTPAGRVFLPEARRILKLSDSAVRWTRRVWKGEAGTLRIGFTAASGYHMLPSLVTRLKKSMPGVDLVLREMVTDAQFEALASGVLDIGFVRPPVDSHRFSSRPFASEPLVLAVPRSHRFASATTPIDLTELADETFVMYSPDGARYFYDLVARVLADANVVPAVGCQVGQIHSMLGLVEAGLGIALVPAAAARLRFVGVTFVNMQIGAGGQCKASLVWSASGDNPLVRALLHHLPQSFDAVDQLIAS